MATIQRYGFTFDTDHYDDAQIERFMIRNGGQWTSGGRTFGNGLLFHFKEYWSRLWPIDDQTRWTDLLLTEILQNQFTAVVGPASSWKTGTIARIALMDWSVFPECTTILMSSTDLAGLRSRVYGETSKLWGIAKDRYDWFPGHPVDYQCVITNADIEEDLVRDVRDGIIGVACKTSSGTFVGYGKYSGRKNRRVWAVSDETQFMQRAMLEAQNNLVSNGPNLVPGLITSGKENGLPKRGYKAVFIGNPNPTVPENPLHLIAEPEGGYGSIPIDGKTKVWDCKRVPDSCVKCRCVNLDGADSPNNDFEGDIPHWPHLVHKDRIAQYEPESESYWSQGRGVIKLGLAAFKVVTKELCEQFHAFDQLVWDGSSPIIKIGGVDAAYGGVGGDRCVAGYIEFGKCTDGRTRILVHPPFLVPVKINPNQIPEDQIAEYCREKMEEAGVLPNNFFFDGRGSLGMSFARLWSPAVNSLEFGGTPTDRIAGPDIFKVGEDGQRRLKLASEHFSKFVSELWFSTQYVITSDQMRGLTLDVVLDGQPREWRNIKLDKVEVESKRDMKKRTGLSPDLFDWLVICVEGARRRGFNIEKAGAMNTNQKRPAHPFNKHAIEFGKIIASRQLQKV